MTRDLTRLLAPMRFEHRWLDGAFVEESRRLGETERGKKHHYVPQMYLRRWAVNGLVQPTQVDSRAVHRPQPVNEVAYSNNFYSFPEVGSTEDLPLKWIETHLGRIESESAKHLDALTEQGTGPVLDDGLKQDLAVFLGLQVTRTKSSRRRVLMLVDGPDDVKRQFLRQQFPWWTENQIDECMNRRQTDPKHEALDLMIKDVRNVIGGGLYQRDWALYRSATSLATCDDPVVLLAGPPYPRSAWVGAGTSAVVMYPVGPHSLLVMSRPGLRHRGSFGLDEVETDSVNTEMVAAAAKTAFERPGDGIAAQIAVPPRPTAAAAIQVQPHLDRDTAALQRFFRAVTPRTRWVANPAEAPGWPVPRWYAG